MEFDECRFAEYSFKELEELELAYALTVHKAQGSEYPAVILPLLNGPRMLMNRNLLYTAVTRAPVSYTHLDVYKRQHVKSAAENAITGRHWK